MAKLEARRHFRNAEVDLDKIIRALGARRTGSGWLARCPVHEDRHPSLSLAAPNGRLIVNCFAGCSWRDVLHELECRGLLAARDQRPPQLVPRPPSRSNNLLAMKIWSETVPLAGTLGEAYLARRGLTRPDDCVDVRYHARCPREDRHQPAVVWLMRDINTNEPRAIQRRFLLPDGSKDGPAKSVGPCAGTVLKVSPDEEVTTGLAIAEGHADVLSVIGAGWRPCWATCGTTAMARFPVLAGIEALTIFCDPNDAGRKAAETCAKRWRATGKEVRVLEPTASGDYGAVAESGVA